MEPILELTEPHAIALCDNIKPGGVHPIQLQDVELVLWRDYAGQAHVWHDRCPHRGMRLSFGFVKENRLTCLYHGWEYGSDGGCRKIPAHPEVTPPKTLCADILNVSESYGMVFVSAGENTVETNTEWVSVRSIFLECDRAQALAGIAEFVEITEAQENQVYLNKSNTVAVAVQPCSRTSCAIHLSTRSTDPTARLTLAKRMVALRRKINQGLRI
jgi:phenylpropionate dioxygenase-like ring-hydroxylating dioxygenase large terminal subunit